MSELPEQLRQLTDRAEWITRSPGWRSRVLRAADEIERLQRELAEEQIKRAETAVIVGRLSAALEPLAAIPVEDFGKQDKPDYPLMGWNHHTIYVRDVMVARAVLRGAHEPAPAKDEVLEAVRAGRVTYPPEVLPTGRWMPADETAGLRPGPGAEVTARGQVRWTTRDLLTNRPAEETTTPPDPADNIPELL